MEWYLPLKVVHVLSAILAVGTNVTYFVWLVAIEGRPSDQKAFALETIRKLDARLANPGYAILPVTGVIMVLIADGLGFTTVWIAVAIALYVLVGVLAGALFAPALRRQVGLVEAGDGASQAYEAAARRTRTTGLVTMLPVAGILYLMVMKPTI